MTADAWRRISDVLGAALELPENKRDSFVVSACEGDDELLSHVRSLLVENDRAGSFLVEPVPGAPGRIVPEDHSQQWDSGAILMGRFRVDRLIGRGGMGEVYAAYDQELSESVAIKVMRGDFEAAGYISRFRREIRLARRISHPNVCRVFDLFRDQIQGRPTYFYVMELLTGESLDSVLARNDLSAARATEIARDMARGLKAAHDAGIIHRDLKPSNVVLAGSDKDSRAVITDFGLAANKQAAETQTSLTESGGILGTPGYMSPEQIAGGSVTPASDIYAYGVILRKILPAVQDCPPGMKESWQKAIARCTAFEPEARFADAIQAFNGANRRSIASRLSRRQWVALGGGATAAMSLGALIPRLLHRGKVLGPEATILIVDILNTTGDATLNSAAEALRVHTSDSSEFKTVDRARLLNVLRQMSLDQSRIGPETAREAAWRANANGVVFGTIARVGPDYSLVLKIEAIGPTPRSPGRSTTRTFSAPDRDALMTAMRDAALWIRSEVGESPAMATAKDGLPPDVTTPSWQALSAYSEAEALAAQDRPSEAVLRLERALDEDPGFTLASSRKADLLMNLQRHRLGIGQWQLTLKRLENRRVTRREELFTRAMSAYDTGEVAEAGRLFATWAQEYPGDWRGHFYSVVPLMLDGHAAEGIRAMERTLRLRPDYTHAYAHIANCAIALGDWNRALEAIEVLRKRGERERPLFKEAMLHLVKYEFDGARTRLQEIQQSGSVSWQVRGRLYEAMLELEAGAPDRSLALLTGGKERLLAPEADTQRAYWNTAKSLAACRLGERRGAIDATNAALEIEDGAVISGYAGSVFARMGRPETARALLGKMRSSPEIRLYQMAAFRIEGELAVAKHDFAAAAESFRRLSDLQSRIADRSSLAATLAKAGDPEAARPFYKSTADAGVLVFFEPMRQEPGVWGDSVRWLQQNP